MGREALVHAEVGTHETGEVKALLEAQELILRGEIRRRFPRSMVGDLSVDGPVLRFSCKGESIALHLGPEAAQAWAKAIATPPPSLRAKLGLDKGAKALLIGIPDDPALSEALDGALVDSREVAAMAIARIDTHSDLINALETCASLPLWTIYPKGKAVPFGDSAIRSALRAAGWRDSKTCAVSERLTATRYNRV
ncbi:hypothetical protein [Rhizobium alvei]|uniref:Siderophore-interacting protein n=1 Tax=Rhizobium alvei TaxID=1132659 RepID=A0ABT8YSJ6_9HYPH|nr:hypothetical protein [Rhizobium alvei]MDO6966732.1 hypothetical protein [Rhizobium alvei]